MEESYSETFLNAKLPKNMMLLRIGLTAAALLVAVAGFLTAMPVLSLVAVVAVVATFFFIPMDIAYEYIFVDGQIDFDRILRGSRRKTMKRSDLADAEVVAPESSHRLDAYQNLPLTDYSSGFSKDRHYIGVFVTDKGSERVRFTPDEKMVQMMEQKAPSKVIRDISIEKKGGDGNGQSNW